MDRMTCDVEHPEEVIEKTLFFEHEKPGVHMEQEVCPKGNNQQKKKKIFKLLIGKNQDVSQWIGNAKAKESVTEGESKRSGNHLEISNPLKKGDLREAKPCKRPLSRNIN